MEAGTADASAEEAPLASLQLYWHSDRCDHLLVASAEGVAYATEHGYRHLRTVGMVQTESTPGAKALVQMHHEALNDHALVIHSEDLLRKGYVVRRVEGYAREFKDLVTGSLPLATYYCSTRCDTVGVADGTTAEEIVKRGDYTLRKIEARILPSNAGSIARVRRYSTGAPRSHDISSTSPLSQRMSEDILPMRVVAPSPQGSAANILRPLHVSERTLEAWLVSSPRGSSGTATAGPRTRTPPSPSSNPASPPGSATLADLHIGTDGALDATYPQHAMMASPRSTRPPPPTVAGGSGGEVGGGAELAGAGGTPPAYSNTTPLGSARRRMVKVYRPPTGVADTLSPGEALARKYAAANSQETTPARASVQPSTSLRDVARSRSGKTPEARAAATAGNGPSSPPETLVAVPRRAAPARNASPTTPRFKAEPQLLPREDSRSPSAPALAVRRVVSSASPDASSLTTNHHIDATVDTPVDAHDSTPLADLPTRANGNDAGLDRTEPAPAARRRFSEDIASSPEDPFDGTVLQLPQSADDDTPLLDSPPARPASMRRRTLEGANIAKGPGSGKAAPGDANGLQASSKRHEAQHEAEMTWRDVTMASSTEITPSRPPPPQTSAGLGGTANVTFVRNAMADPIGAFFEAEDSETTMSPKPSPLVAARTEDPLPHMSLHPPDKQGGAVTPRRRAASSRQALPPPLSIDAGRPDALRKSPSGTARPRTQTLGPQRRASQLIDPSSMGSMYSVLIREKPNLMQLDKLSTEHLEALTDATIRIQKIFRGHSDRLRFKTGLAARMASIVDRVVENETTEKNLMQLQATLTRMRESLLVLGATPPEISEFRQLADRFTNRYTKIANDAVVRKEKASQRIDRLKEIVRDDAKKQVEPHFVRRMFNRAVAWVWSIRFISVLAWVCSLAMGPQNANEEDMGSQQTAWNTEPVFRSIVTGNVEDFKRIVTLKPITAHARDHFGATPLLVAMLIHRAPQRTMAAWLLKKNNRLAEDMYFNELFKGEIALHFAIVHRNHTMVKMLLDAHPQGLYQRATGAFFQDREEGCYFGEWPLMFAAATNQPDLVLMLIELGERHGKKRHELLDIRDSDANTLLHICVWHNLPDMYSFIEALCKEASPQPSFYECGLSACYNKDGLTPFSLSAERGHVEMFSHLLEANTQVTWKYGAHSFRAVFIDEIESGVSDKPSILEILVEKEHKALLDLPLVRSFLEKKWTKFVQRVFFRRIFQVSVYTAFFLLALVTEAHARPFAGSCLSRLEPLWPFYEREGLLDHLMRFDTAVYFSDEKKVDIYEIAQKAMLDFVTCEFHLTFATDWWLFASRFSNTVVLVGAVWKARRELSELQEGGFSAYFGVKGSMLLENVLASMFCVCINLTFLFRLFGWDAEALFGAASALLLWAYVLWLMLGFQATGPFIIMIWKMLADDMIQFLVIFLTFQLGFTQAFHLVLHSEDFTPFTEHLKSSFEVLLGAIDLNITSDMTPYPLLAYILSVVYAVLVTILLLNLLISKMSTTFSTIQQESDVIWNLEFSRMILSLEGEISSEDKLNLKWWSIMDGRRCFMLPMLTQGGKQEYWNDYEPNWDGIRRHKRRPASFKVPNLAALRNPAVPPSSPTRTPSERSPPLSPPLRSGR